jgi:hypothetical protein
MPTMNCNQAQPLVPSYLDGELSEAQAGPLRKHLLDCQPCRASAQGDKNLKRWFVEDEALAIPRDFASRVAHRALSGERGEARHFESLPRERFGIASPIAGAGRRDENGLRFILQLTALAAGALFLVSLAIGSWKLPSGSRMQADSTREPKLDRAIEELDRLNDAEKRTIVAPPSTGAAAHATESSDPRAKDAGSTKQ